MQIMFVFEQTFALRHLCLLWFITQKTNWIATKDNQVYEYDFIEGVEVYYMYI